LQCNYDSRWTTVGDHMEYSSGR